MSHYLPVLCIFLWGCTDDEELQFSAGNVVGVAFAEVELIDSVGYSGKELLYLLELYTTFAPTYYATLGASAAEVHPELFKASITGGLSANNEIVRGAAHLQFRMEMGEAIRGIYRRLTSTRKSPSFVLFAPFHAIMMAIRINEHFLKEAHEPENKFTLASKNRFHAPNYRGSAASALKYALNSHAHTRATVEFYLWFKGLSDYFAHIYPSSNSNSLAIAFIEKYVMSLLLRDMRMYTMKDAKVDPKTGLSKVPLSLVYCVDHWYRWIMDSEDEAIGYNKDLLAIENFISLGMDYFKNAKDFETTVVPIVKNFFDLCQTWWDRMDKLPIMPEPDRLAVLGTLSEYANTLNEFKLANS